MLLGGMLASSLMLPLSLLVSVSFCLSPLVCAAWPWLLFWGLCPPGVLATMLGDHPAFFEEMREGFARLAWIPCSGAFFEFLLKCWPPAFLVSCSVFISCMPFSVSSSCFFYGAI